MPEQAKIEGCPFPTCGGKCETTVLLDDSWRVDCEGGEWARKMLGTLEEE